MMKKLAYILLFAGTTIFFACSEDELDSESIFDTTVPAVQDKFDLWLQKNYTDSFNIQFNYKYDDKESNMEYDLTPAEYGKSIALAKMLKHVWIDSYSEVGGADFIKKVSPRLIQLIGSKAYNDDGSTVLGAAEGGLKITFYNVNEINLSHPNLEMLNKWFFTTMQHEYMHILHQTKNYDPQFKEISKDYQGPSWVNWSDSLAQTKGFISAYASMEDQEDFAETYSSYITCNDSIWQHKIKNAGPIGAPIIETKLDYIRKYMTESWNIDMDKMRETVLQHSEEILKMNLTELNLK